jgi:ATP-dependent phosphofructokinase / diphosphate-dependent phosphofructokinase
MSRLEGKALVAQGGGPTAVINQSVVGVVLEARKYPQVTHVYGALHGVRGIIDENFLDLTEATTHNLEAVAATPSAGLLSTRDKPDVDYCKNIFEMCKVHNIRYFFYIGGNDSADTARIVNDHGQAGRLRAARFHVPKTIDNDLRVTTTPPATARPPSSWPRPSWATTSTTAPPRRQDQRRHGPPRRLPHRRLRPRPRPDDGPHLIYLPERAFVEEKFLADVKAVYEKPTAAASSPSPRASATRTAPP